MSVNASLGCTSSPLLEGQSLRQAARSRDEDHVRRDDGPPGGSRRQALRPSEALGTIGASNPAVYAH